MLDIKLLREQPDLVRRRLASRGAGDEGHVDELLRLDEQRRKLLGVALPLCSRSKLGRALLTKERRTGAGAISRATGVRAHRDGQGHLWYSRRRATDYSG